MNKKAIIEMVKEAIRLAILAAISAVLAYAGQVLAGLDPSSTTVVIGTLVLRVLDKFVHESNLKANGISPV